MSASSDSRPLLDVAVGILTAPDGRVLLGQRPRGKPYAGWWEFPGGKVEPGESVGEAIVRELHEELGLTILHSSAWLMREHAYEHARVRLHFRRIHRWTGAPESREGQDFRWCDPACAEVAPLLPATVPLMRLLALPPVYGISAAAELGTEKFLERLDGALAAGLRLVQLREPALDEKAFATLFEAALVRCRAHGASLLVNSLHDRSYWERADGVHLRAADLDRVPVWDERGSRTVDGHAADRWIAASCHDAVELAAAACAGADYAVLSPVMPTRSHPGAPTLGWAGFAAANASTKLPVYALGGLAQGDLTQAQDLGAHGIAMIGGLFRAG